VSTTPAQDSLGQYLREIGRIPLLTPAEELHLGTMVRAWLDHPDGPEGAPVGIRRRGLKARDRMVQANLRLVVVIAKKHMQRAARVGLTLHDCIQEGTIGLVRGVEKFDPARGYKFSTYAYWWCIQGIRRVLETAGTIRVPTGARSLAGKVVSALRELGPGATIEQAAEVIGQPASRCQRAMSAVAIAGTMSSLDEPLRHHDGEGGVLVDFLADPNSEPSIQGLDLELAVSRLRAALPEEVELMSRWAAGQTRREIALEEGITHQGVGHRLDVARKRLRAVAGPEALQLLEGAA
jgi:RNA polymerase sigma factor (sigma-70 family)